MQELREHYSGFGVSQVGYTTVRDFSDSLERLHALATTQGDLKDAQRPWMVKALWSLLPHGGRIVEVGAGQPYVADLLSQTGYDVTIVDPYDGSGNGPVEFEEYRSAYPHLTFVRSSFGADIEQRLPAESFDAVFSISVLEHLSPVEIASVTRGARALLKANGWSIQSVDHVLEGRDATQSLERLSALAEQHGVREGELRRTLRDAQRDAETYFLSAESHERWRAFLGVSYAEYPMQRVVSVSVAARREQLNADSG